MVSKAWNQIKSLDLIHIMHFGPLTDLYGTPGAPKRAHFGPKRPFLGTLRSSESLGGQIWSQLPLIGPTQLVTWHPHTLAWYRPSSGTPWLPFAPLGTPWFPHPSVVTTMNMPWSTELFKWDWTIPEMVNIVTDCGANLSGPVTSDNTLATTSIWRCCRVSGSSGSTSSGQVSDSQFTKLTPLTLLKGSVVYFTT